MEVTAFRGKQRLCEEELRAYLSLATRMENLGVLLGAGASRGCGGHLVSEIWSNFTELYPGSLEWLVNKSFLKEAGGDRVEIESLLENLLVADREWERTGDPELLDLRRHTANVKRAVLNGATLSRDCLSEPDPQWAAAKLAQHQNMLSRLIGTRQPGQPAPWIFTTNYDLAIEWAGEFRGIRIVNGFAGNHYRSFAPTNFDLAFRNVQARGEARFGAYHVYLAKLHGSLTWSEDAQASIREHPCAQIAQQVFDFLDSSTDECPCLLVYPSAAKYVQTAGFVYGELLRRFVDFLSQPNTVLFVNGYSFADEHINRVLSTALQNPTLQLVLHSSRLTQAGDIEGGSPWLQRLAAASLPQVTIVGGTDGAAYFDGFVALLPEPAMLEREVQKEVNRARLLRELGTVSPLADGQPVSEGTDE